MAGIRTEPNGALRVHWRLGGRRDGRQQSVTVDGDKVAAAAKALVESRDHNITRPEVYALLFPQDDNSTLPTLADWARTWAKEREEDDIQPDTLAGYIQSAGRWIVPQLGHHRLDQIGTVVIADWVSWLKRQNSKHGRPLSGDTIRHVHGLLHQILGAAVPKYLQANPAARPRGSRRSTKGLPKYVRFDATFLTPTEADLLLSRCDDVIGSIAKVALYTGLRLGELLALRVGDLDLYASTPCIHVRRALKNDGAVGAPKSVRSKRTVSLSGTPLAVLRAAVEGKGRSALVFPSPTGVMWHKENLIKRHWIPAVASAQRCPEHMPPEPPKPRRGPRRNYRPDEVSTCSCPTRLHKAVRFHDTRHTAASWMIKAGFNIVTISRRLGHESITTTIDIYGHLMPQGDEGELEALEAFALAA